MHWLRLAFVVSNFNRHFSEAIGHAISITLSTTT